MDVETHKLRDWEVEFPTMINGHAAHNSFFIYSVGHKNFHRSQFGIFYGVGENSLEPGRWAADFPEILPEYVKKWLDRKAANHKWNYLSGLKAHDAT